MHVMRGLHDEFNQQLYTEAPTYPKEHQKTKSILPELGFQSPIISFTRYVLSFPTSNHPIQILCFGSLLACLFQVPEG